MRTITVCCHGTGYDSHSGQIEKELVDWISRHIQGPRLDMDKGVVANAGLGTHLVLQGPASMVGNKDHMTTPVLPPNMLDPKTGNARDLKVMTTREQRWLGVKVVKNLAGMIGGHGWDTNVKLAMNILQAAHAAAPIHVINMVGWSRGGVTCIKLARALFETNWSNGIPCHLFVIDPVAGTYKGKQDENRTLNANVKFYISTLAMHETRGFFHVQDADMIQSTPFTKCTMLPMPGVHNTAPIGKTDVADITANLACAFLKQFGTELTKVRRPALGYYGEMVAAYARIINNFQSYVPNVGLATKMQGGSDPRAFLQKLHQYVKSDYWVNEHHRRCFKEDYGSVYNFMFHASNGATARIRDIDPGFHQLLAGGTPAGNQIRASLRSKHLIAEMGNEFYTLGGIGRGRHAGQSSGVLNKWPLNLKTRAF